VEPPLRITSKPKKCGSRLLPFTDHGSEYQTRFRFQGVAKGTAQNFAGTTVRPWATNRIQADFPSETSSALSNKDTRVPSGETYSNPNSILYWKGHFGIIWNSFKPYKETDKEFQRKSLNGLTKQKLVRFQPLAYISRKIAVQIFFFTSWNQAQNLTPHEIKKPYL